MFPQERELEQRLNILSQGRDISWNCRRRASLGFQKCIWWQSPDREQSPLDWLVILSLAGEIAILKCDHFDIENEKRWERIEGWENLMREGQKYTVNDVVTSSDGGVMLVHEDGAIVKVTAQGDEERRVIQLNPGEIVLRGAEIDSRDIILATSQGRLLKMSQCQRLLCLTNDNVLLPGIIHRACMDDFLVITKFNHIYLVRPSRVSEGTGEIKVIALPENDSVITVVLEGRDEMGSMMIVGTESGQWFNVIIQESLTCCSRMKSPPWVEAEGDKYSPGDSARPENDASEDSEAEEAETLEDKVPSAQMEDVTIDGFCSHLGVSWVLETKNRQYPLPNRALLHLVANQKMMVRQEDDPDPREIFVRKCFGETTFQAAYPNLSAEHCPQCNSTLKVPTCNVRTCYCSNGHIFEICVFTGNPIPDINQSSRCFVCRDSTTLDHFGRRCACGGIFLRKGL